MSKSVAAMPAKRTALSRVRSRAPRPAAPDERVFRSIHGAILDHRLAPGTKLKELELAGIFGVSRDVVRKVLARLHHGMLVEQRPNRGAVVAKPTISDTRDLFEARRAIEAAIIEALGRTLTRDKLQRLQRHIDREQQAYDRSDLRNGLRLSIQFHRLLAEAAGNGVLSRFLQEELSRTPLTVLAHMGSQPSYCGAGEHQAILDEIARGNTGKSITLMHKHIDHLQSQLRLVEAETPKSLAEVFDL